MLKKWEQKPFFSLLNQTLSKMTLRKFYQLLPYLEAPTIDRITATLPFLTMIDLIYAHFLEMDRERKERIFNSYWENKKLNGYDSRRR